jgi:hypothetical protein
MCRQGLVSHATGFAPLRGASRLARGTLDSFVKDPGGRDGWDESHVWGRRTGLTEPGRLRQAGRPRFRQMRAGMKYGETS